VSSFGADQFDDTDPQERIKKGSFFNWFYFSINIGALVSSSFIVWIQENAGWGLGFGIPALFMGLAIGSFFLGTPLYRFQKPGGSPLTRMCQVVAASFRKRNLDVPEDSSLLYETPDKSSAIEGSRKLEHSDELRLVFPYFEFTVALFSAFVTLAKNKGVCSMNNNNLFLIFLLKWNAPSLQIQSSLIKGNIILNMSPTIML
jgi:MFS family permease